MENQARLSKQLEQWFQFYQEKHLKPNRNNAMLLTPILFFCVGFMIMNYEDTVKNYILMIIVVTSLCASVAVLIGTQKILLNIEEAELLAFRDLKRLHDNGYQVAVLDNQTYKKHSLLFMVNGQTLQIRPNLVESRFCWYDPKKDYAFLMPLTAKDLALITQHEW
ncbi:hypothetical protein [Photobacterium leiognathi]|uniref:hypothetical protein n=1 Tax=Photobacterium leiognathi TaxID=553611 RepID=UPI002980E5AC|nr:hypothetical protein [Photobacterium leiognathi]